MPRPSRAAKPVPVSEVRSRVDGLPSEQEELDGSDEESGGFDGPGDRRPAAEWMEREVAAMERAAAGMAGSPSGARRAPRRADPSDPADFPYGSYESADPRKPASRRADPSDPAEPYADVASDDLRTDPRNYERYIPPSAPGSAIADGSFPGPDDVPASPSRPTLPGSPARVPAPGARGSPAARTDVRRAVKGSLDDMERMVAEFGQHLSDMDAYEEPESSALTAAILPAPSAVEPVEFVDLVAASEPEDASPAEQEAHMKRNFTNASPAPAPAASRADTTDQDLSTHTFQTSSDESASPADHPDDSDESAIRRIIAETAALSGSSKSMSASNQTSQPSASSNGSSEDRALEAAAEFLKVRTPNLFPPLALAPLTPPRPTQDLTLDKTREPNASSNASSDAVDAESQVRPARERSEREKESQRQHRPPYLLLCARAERAGVPGEHPKTEASVLERALVSLALEDRASSFSCARSFRSHSKAEHPPSRERSRARARVARCTRPLSFVLASPPPPPPFSPPPLRRPS
jgi:hypothetical protein